MSQSLSRRQSVVLGLVVVLAVGLSGVGLTQVAARQGIWADTFEVTVAFPEAHDVGPGTPVRIRGVDAGQVVAVEYPDHDGPDAAVTLRLRVDGKFAGRLYADASAQVLPTGLLGSKVVAIRPGTPASGPLADGRVKAEDSPDFARTAAQLGDATKKMSQTADKIGATADETKDLVHDIRTSNGTFAKLVKDDELYQDMKGLAKDSRAMVQRADAAVGKVEGEVQKVDQFVADGRDTLRSVKQGTDALQKLPIVRSYVEDSAALLVRPTCRREMFPFHTVHLFEPGTALLTDDGRTHLGRIADLIKGTSVDSAEVVVVAQCDPADRTQTSASAAELTKKQSEAVVEFLKAHGVHKIGWVSRRKVTPLGLGFGPSPVVEKEPLPPSHLQVLVFTPQ